MRMKQVDRLINQMKVRLGITEEMAHACRKIYSDLSGKPDFSEPQRKGEAVEHWTKGRQTIHVVAAAMYMVCREKETPHLLIDFSDLFQVNMYTLAKCYLKIIKKLHWPDLPPIDPMFYIDRFCRDLNLGENKREVENTALFIIKNMKHNWMVYGRRPTGLIGAAILIAARFHGFKLTTADIVKVVHVCDETIRKRLDEFKSTKAANMSLSREVRQPPNCPEFFFK